MAKAFACLTFYPQLNFAFPNFQFFIMAAIKLNRCIQSTSVLNISVNALDIPATLTLCKIADLSGTF